MSSFDLEVDSCVKCMSSFCLSLGAVWVRPAYACAGKNKIVSGTGMLLCRRYVQSGQYRRGKHGTVPCFFFGIPCTNQL